MKEKKTAKKGSRNAQPERLPETNTKALNHEQEKLRQWFQEVKFRKVLFGGVDEIVHVTMHSLPTTREAAMP